MALSDRFAENMRHRRKELGLTQENLAHICDLDRSYVGHIEQKVNVPTIESVEKICKGLKISPSEILSSNYPMPEGEYFLCKLSGEDWSFHPIEPEKIDEADKEELDKMCKE